MVPVAYLYLGSRIRVSAAREARAASGSAVAVVEPSAKTLGFRENGFTNPSPSIPLVKGLAQRWAENSEYLSMGP